jgi:hypothetical protein
MVGSLFFLYLQLPLQMTEIPQISNALALDESQLLPILEFINEVDEFRALGWG